MAFRTAPEQSSPHRVVAGYDGSPGSHAALEYAATAAGAEGEVYVVHAYDPRRGAALTRARATVRALQLETAGPLARVAWLPEIVGGDPAEAIAEVAATRLADEVVVGCSPAGNVFGSLLALVDVPVTAIPPRAALRAA